MAALATSFFRMQALRELEAESHAVLTFEEFFLAQYERLYKSLLLVTGSRADAEDMAQETMARVFERWTKVRDLESPEAYTYTIAFNLNRRRVRDLFRMNERHRSHELAEDRLQPATEPETRIDMVSAMATLPRDQRTALVLVDWLGFDSVQAGHILDVTPGTMRTRLHRARSSLRSRLGETHE